jgi:hypothetical protein
LRGYLTVLGWFHDDGDRCPSRTDRAPAQERPAYRAALDTLRDGLVEELGLTPAEATREIRAAMIRRAQASRNPATRQLAAELAKVEGL